MFNAHAQYVSARRIYPRKRQLDCFVFVLSFIAIADMEEEDKSGACVRESCQKTAIYSLSESAANGARERERKTGKPA